MSRPTSNHGPDAALLLRTSVMMTISISKR